MRKRVLFLVIILIPVFVFLCLAAARYVFRASSSDNSVYSDYSDYKGLEERCRELEEEFSGFSVFITHPATGTAEFIHNPAMVFKERYCPGSLLKPFVIIAREKTDELVPGTSFVCSGYEDPVWPCWLGQGHGELDLAAALAHSCNSYFYKFASTGLSRAAYVQVLREYDLKLFGSEFTMTDDEFYSTAFGLGIFYNIHPVRMLYAYNALFNGGALYNSEGRMVRTVQIEPAALDIIRQGMMEGYFYGTSKLIFQKTHIPDVIAKTGTGASTTGSGTFDWRKNIGWVVVMYPSYNPRFSMLVVMEKSKSSVACTVASEILNYIDKNSQLFKR